MKDEETLERAILEYLSMDDDKIESFQSFTTIFEKMAEPYTRGTTYFRDGGEINRKEYVRAFLDQMEADGLLETRMDSRGYERMYRATDQGIYERSFQDLALEIDPVEEKPDVGNEIDSSAWTGLPKIGTLSDASADRLKVALALIDQSVARFEASNEERAQARAYLLALQALADAPEPPAELIWKIITVAAALSGIGSLFVALIELYK